MSDGFDSDDRFLFPPKLERVAMEEVRHGLIHYTLPEPKPATEEAA